MKKFFLSCCLLFNFTVYCQDIQLEVFSQGFSLPVDISHAGDDRLFITEKAGLIRILNPDGNKPALPFLDIKNRVNSAANERGLLGLCFHPKYKENGYFFVNYTNSAGHSTISRFSVTGNPDIADANFEKIILVVNQPFNNHNAGDLVFGPDGYLYVGFGDGGSGGDPGNRSQNPQNLLGKMLRLDVNTEEPYLIPADNPWAGNQDTLPEIWAFGLRNPWRFSFDRMTGDLWIGDVGQNKWEEINYMSKGTPGINYGWRCYEGFESYNASGCKDISFYTPPVFAYRNPTLGCSVTGGFVYRGPEASRYVGNYIFADYCSGRFWSVRQNNNEFEGIEIAKFSANQFVTFGENHKGSLFVAGIGNGTIYKVLDPKCGYLDALDFIDVTAPTCHDSCDASILAQGPPSLSTYEWSTGSSIPVLENLCPGQYFLTVTDTIGCRKSYEITIDSVIPLSVQLTLEGDVLKAVANDDIQLYQWFKNGILIPGADKDTLMSRGNGLYHVGVTNDAGCEDLSEEITILNCTYLEDETSITIYPVTCRDSCNASLTLSIPDPDIKILWNTGDTLPEISSLCPGDYTVTLVDKDGCSATLAMFISEAPELTVELNMAGQFMAAFSNQTVTYQWYRDGALIPGANQQTYEVVISGEYYVEVTNEKGCIVRSTSIIITNTQEIENPGPVMRCRTLSGEGIQFMFESDVRGSIMVTDVSGKILHQETSDYAQMTWQKISLQSGSDGYYFMQIIIGKRQYVYKVFLKF